MSVPIQPQLWGPWRQSLHFCCSCCVPPPPADFPTFLFFLSPAGDKEKEAGLEVLPMFDREKAPDRTTAYGVPNPPPPTSLPPGVTD